MKRVLLILIVILFLSAISFPAFAGGDWRYLETKYTSDAPDLLYLSSFRHSNPDGIQQKFQNSLVFHFIDGKEIQEEFTVLEEVDSDAPPREYKLSFNLKYNTKSLRRYNDVFITGTFDYYHVGTDSTDDFSGEVKGQIILFNPTRFGLIGTNSNDVGAVVLRLNAPDYGFSVDFFLNPNGTGLLISSDESETVRQRDIPYSNYYEDEHRPHIPSPSNQADVAAGVAISTIGIFAVNAFTGTSIFGNASYNGSFNPSAPPAPAAPTPPYAASGSSGGGFLGTISDFFKNLFADLRDMLTDEGRSYASGRLEELLEDTVQDESEPDV